MQIKNKTGKTLKLYTGTNGPRGREFIAIPPGTNDIPVDTKNKQQMFRVNVMAEAGMIEVPGLKIIAADKTAEKEEKADVGESQKSAGAAGRQRNSSRGGGTVSDGTKDEGQ